MGLFDFLKPKWKSKNPEVRLASVQTLGTQELGTLKTVAAGDEDRRVQLAAIERIGNRKALEELAGGALEPEVLRVLTAKIDRLLCEEALGGSAPVGVEAALGRIEDLALVERLAAEAPTPGLRVKAVERITDQEALCRIVETNCGKEPARVALTKIDQEPLLARVAKTGASKVTRRLAEEKLAALAAERERPTREEQRRLELAALAEEAEKLASSQEWAKASVRYISLVQTWLELDPNRAHPLWSGFEDARKRFDANKEEAARRAAEAKLQAQAPVVESREIAAKEPATQEAARGEEPLPQEHPEERAAAERLAQERDLGRARLAARADEEARAMRVALEKRAALCAELEGLAEAEDRAAAGRRAKQLRTEWKQLPPSREKDARALEERFRAAGDRFSVSQAAYLEQQEWLRWNNKTLKEELCAMMEALETEEDLANVAAQVKEAQRRWKEIGAAPKAEAEALWQRFKSACDSAFDRCKPYFEELEQRRAEGVELREELCRQAEAHVDSTDWKESAEALKLMQAQWKNAEPLPRKQDEALYTRFRQACDRFFERRQAHFAQLDEGRQGIQAEKEKLCERAEALAAAPERKYTREFRQLQAAWKQLGPAPRDVDKALWERFRASCDGFFAWLDAGRQENLRKKEALCEEVETLMAAAKDADPAEISEKINDLQMRWNEIGAVPREQEDAIWDRFHKPCDEFFEARRNVQEGPGTATGESQAG